MILKSFSASVQVTRKYLFAAANNVNNCCRVIPIRNYRHCSIVSKLRVHAQPILSNITCHKCQVHRHYSRGILDGDTLELQNAQKERELKNLSTIFPNPRVTLNELAAKSPSGASVFDIQYKQASVAPKGARKKVVQNDWMCTYTFVWPQKIKFESTAKSKRQAAEKAASLALHWLHTNERIDSKGYPIFDKTVVEELRNSLQEPIKASISENSMDTIGRIWEDYENGIKNIYTATFEAAARRVVASPAILTKDSTIDEQDTEISDDTDLTNEADIVTESKISFHPVYGRHIPPPTETALDRRKRQLTKTFQVYDEERTHLPIDEYRALLELATCVETHQEPIEFTPIDAALYPKTGLIVCLLCLEDMETNLLSDHMVNAHGYRKVQLKCQLCGTKFAERSLLTIYKKECRPQEKRQKRKSFQQIMKELDGKNYDSDDNPGSCPICSVQLPRHRIRDHLTAAHMAAELSLACDVCARTFKNKPTLREHVRLVHDAVGDAAACAECGQRFRSQKYLANHRRNVHPAGNKVHTCPVCGKGFKSRLCLHQHVKHVHPPAAAAARCPHCPGKLFKSKVNLHQHLRVSHGQYKKDPTLPY